MWECFVHNILPITLEFCIIIYAIVFILNVNPIFIVEVRFGLWMAHLRKQSLIWFVKNGSEMNLMSSWSVWDMGIGQTLHVCV